MEPFLLIGEHVALEPMSMEHVEELVAAADEDRSTYTWAFVPESTEEMAAFVERLLADRDAGRAVPFVQRRLVDGQLVGCTRYLELRSWSGRDVPDEVEVGGTWLAASAQRTPINTEAKLLLFTHAFETWRVQRLAVATDARNERSKAAIQRVGARFEGILRHHRGSYAPGETGQPRDSAIFSIVPAEWPTVKAALLARLAERPR